MLLLLSSGPHLSPAGGPRNQRRAGLGRRGFVNLPVYHDTLWACHSGGVVPLEQGLPGDVVEDAQPLQGEGGGGGARERD